MSVSPWPSLFTTDGVGMEHVGAPPAADGGPGIAGGIHTSGFDRGASEGVCAVVGGAVVVEGAVLVVVVGLTCTSKQDSPSQPGAAATVSPAWAPALERKPAPPNAIRAPRPYR
ncbi:MAG: hypothetical protein ACRDV9_12085 [Acidimicrobiia bacterium]